MRTPAWMLLSALADLGLIQTVSIQIVPITGSQTSLLLNVKRCLLAQCTWLGQPNPSQPSCFLNSTVSLLSSGDVRVSFLLNLIQVSAVEEAETRAPRTASSVHGLSCADVDLNIKKRAGDKEKTFV